MAISTNSSGRPGLHRPLADINVTPLVDVMLVLLIVFMVTAPLMTTGLKVNLPQAKAAQPLKQSTPIVLSVTADGKLALGNDEIDLESIVPAIQARMEGDLSRVVQVRADNGAKYGVVVDIFDRLVSNGMTHVALVSDPKSRGKTLSVTRSLPSPTTP